MSLAYKQLKVYLRVGIVLTVVVLGAIVLFMNRDQWVQLWFFGLTDPDKPTNVVWVMLWTAAITRTGWWLFSFGRGMIRDMREIRRRLTTEENEKAQRKRAAALDQQERTIDEKLKQIDEGENIDGL